MEFLKELAPQTEHIALIYDPQIRQRPDTGRRSKRVHRHSNCKCPSIPCATPSKLSAPWVWSRAAEQCLVILPGPAPSVRTDLVVALANRHRLPAVYPFRYWSPKRTGVLRDRQHRVTPQAATYVDRILKVKSQATCPSECDQIRIGHQPQDSQGAGHQSAEYLLARTDEVIE